MTNVALKPNLEDVGAAFTVEKMLFVRDRTRKAIHEIAARVTPGMAEEDAVEMAKDLLAGLDMVKGWHDVYVRFGSNTLKTFGAPSDPGVILGENDVFFIDIGPVWKDWEGDGGDTFIVGSNAEMARCAADARKLFHIVRKKWTETGLSGKGLYDFAAAEAEAMGWELNLDLSGHRLSDFPHAAVYDGPLAEIDFRPSPLLWVLEIHIRDRDRKFGAFFEDMLLDDSYFAQ
jgi:Xaa-Pro aminopeptidase